MKIKNKPFLIIGLINWVLIVTLMAGAYLLNGCKMPEPDTETAQVMVIDIEIWGIE